MAYKIKLNKRFIKDSKKVAAWLEEEWSKKVADEFAQKLNTVILSLANNPQVGPPSATPLVRKFTVTKHNKVYYRVKGKTITLLVLFDVRQDPRKNKYE